MQKFTLPFVLMLIGGFLISNLPVQAQRPPTGGPNTAPADEEKFPVVLYPVIGVSVAAATYWVIKKLPRKIPPAQSLSAYLVNRHILPSPDALALMYALNPGLKGLRAVRPNKKLVAPDLPPLPEYMARTATTIPANAALLPGQLAAFRSNLAVFQRSRITVKATNTDLNKIKVLLGDMEKKLTAFDNLKDAGSPVRMQFIADLLQVLNQSLKQNISTRVFNDRDDALLQDISDNLDELLSPLLASRSSKGKLQGRGGPTISGQRNPEYALAGGGLRNDYPLAALAAPVRDYQPQMGGSSTTSPPAAPNMEQVFAFAIYKIDAQGRAITKGPEVEGKYFIQYVCPALKDYKNYYHNISPPPATYAAAKLPPAKFYLIVKDMQGRPVPLQNPLIDTRDIFRNPQRDYFKHMILVTVYVTQ